MNNSKNKKGTFFHLKNLKRTKSIFSRLEKIRLDKNEKSDDHSKIFFKKVIKKIKHHHLSAYPESEKVYSLLSKKLRLSQKSILITYGADGGIKTCFDFLANEGDKIIYFDPTFAMVSVYSQIKKLKPIILKYNKNLKIDLLDLKKKVTNHNIKFLIFANPNSPTGNSFKNSEIIEIIKICKKNNTYVIIDEAYFGFYKNSFIKFIEKFKNLLIIRTFSKSFGLAGLRAGYLITNKTLCQKIFKIKPMYEMTSLTSIFVEEILKNENLEKRYISNILDSKDHLIKFLKKGKINFINTDANFIHIELKKNKKKFVNLLKNNNILISDKTIIKGLESFIRISIGSKKQINKFLKLFKKYYGIK
jgi:histidinol-phosphate aminotransferase